ncbi:thiopurine S-methyltransferase [Salinivibrio kushneri]|uniref:Thiopurine S-methyltransferase n=1 Tax=Salinivibrio kushneri TaxID=1908198 RepID=A0AB36K220_9GAMM|nr:thiopurine S-methyltransferase [Salinivibrio kushneri]OOE41639.1 thiopurine S-methyltransferase [Salinivibrio kushneri]QCP02188.1 thiopurine S-methyltransferase [Salinivibrio kushneri]
MEQEFWHQRWAENQIGFHRDTVHPMLIRHWPSLAPQSDETVLVPLCGKSIDLNWLAEKHQHVIGVELSEIAVRAFFSENLYTPQVYRAPSGHTHYCFDELELINGDFFTARLSPMPLIYDRAALVAMPPAMRAQYVSHIRTLLAPGGRLLLITLFYPQADDTPPFSIDASVVEEAFQGLDFRLLETHTEPDGERGEQAWLIKAAAS